MNEIAGRYADQGVGSIFLYTHEAHPGENYGHLTSMAQKLQHGQALSDVYGARRPILADALDGACHRAYGSMSNMSWIFTQSGIPVYKSDWTDAHRVENAIRYFLEVVDRRRGGERLAPFPMERLDFRRQDTEAFFQGLGCCCLEPRPVLPARRRPRRRRRRCRWRRPL